MIYIYPGTYQISYLAKFQFMVWGSRGSQGSRGSGAPGHWGSHDPLKINTRRKSEVKFIFQNSASLDPRTGLSPLTSPSSPPTPPPRRRYRPTKSLQFTCHGLLSIPHQLLHALLLLLLLFLTLLQTLVSSSCSSPIINALAPPSFSTLSPQSISCGLISNFATGFQNFLFALIQTFFKVVNSETMGREDYLVSFYHRMPGSHQLCH